MPQPYESMTAVDVLTDVIFSLQLALIINLGCRNFRFGWRITLSVTVLAGAILTIGSNFLPESPRYIFQFSVICKLLATLKAF